MDNYEDKSDDEINLAVQHLRQGAQLYGPPIDYCNNASYAWHIILEQGINIIWSYGSAAKKWTASNTMKLLPDSKKGEFEVVNKNPLRAAMIVFLKMEAAK